MQKDISHLILEDRHYISHPHYYGFPILKKSEEIKANEFYFNQPAWVEEYLTFCHRSEAFRARWQAVTGDWSGKTIVDIGCGPGNIFATLKGQPEYLIGVDVAQNSLKVAGELGYTGVLADAHDLPFRPGVADLVILNAALHHCEQMDVVLREAARLVKPGGLLVTDHDPQYSAWNYKGIGKLLWNARLTYYRIIGYGFHKSTEQQKWALASEIHHKPGHGVTRELFSGVLLPEDFDVKIYPHNHNIGADILKGEKGKAEWKYSLANILSGRNPFSDDSALSLMCVARKM